MSDNLPAVPDNVVSITTAQKKQALESSLFQFMTTDPFYACFLQEITIKYNEWLPTACMGYDKKRNEFEMHINPQFFISLSKQERVAILFHEVLHFMNKHLFRFNMEGPEEEVKMKNIAMDMAINQHITGLPKGSVGVKDFKCKDDKNNTVPFPTNKPAEVYLELLKDPKNKKVNKDILEKYMPGEGKGIHKWDDLSEEDKERMLTEMRKVLQRTVEKSSTSHSNIPDSVKDLLSVLDAEIGKLNYKEILRRAIKRTMSVSDREYTWKRPSKRFGEYARGSECGKLPSCSFSIDTSGSISHRELNEFLQVMAGFLKAGNKKCTLALWHTSMYHKQSYKLNNEIPAEIIQSGGTCVEAALQDIKKSNPNLAIILTDGYFEHVDIKLGSEVIFVISKGGNKEHPMKHMGKTIMLDALV